MDYVLETDNLEKKYKKVKALNSLNMHVEKGSIYGLSGKNGAGKTTLLRIICGLQEPTNGKYSIFGISNGNKKIIRARMKIGAIIEIPSINLDMSAKDNLVEQHKIIGLPIDKNNIREILTMVGLSDLENKKAKDFSLGMKQRLGIAIALVGNPEFIILDEPLNGLDPEGIITLRRLILKLNNEKGITFLISSHYLNELSKIATQYGFIDKGAIIKEIYSKELGKKTLEEYYTYLIGK